MDISKELGKWYDINKRNLPWRNTDDPYKIWISEIILQQTRVNQGMAYYNRFLDNFPTIGQLASASLDEVLKIWQGLGYYTRARNMHQTAQFIVSRLDGIFPREYISLQNLKGIGAYTAAAIASIAFNEPVPLVDGNVYRVLSRFYGVDINITDVKGKKHFQSVAARILDPKQPGRHNQAMMELGAIICIPHNPLCGQCPLKNECFSHQRNCVEKFPQKKKKTKQKARYFNYLVIKTQSGIFLKQRKDGDIWAHLYEFPLIETTRKCELADLERSEAWKNIFGTAKVKIINVSEDLKHQLTHQVVYARFIECNVKKDFILEKSLAVEVEFDKLESYPVSRLIERFLNLGK